MARPRADAHPVATPTRLLAAARWEFARRGRAAARLEDVAAEAGVTRPSLLHHFASKEALYAATVQAAFVELGAALERGLAGPGRFEARLERTVGELHACLAEAPDLARLVVREVLDEEGPGRALVEAAAEPLLARVAAFVEAEASPARRSRIPVREALMQVAADSLLHAAVGPLGPALWGPRPDPVARARVLILEAP